MRYIDTGSRDPANALGTWFEAMLNQASQIATVRVQTGFFSSNVLGYLGPHLAVCHSETVSPAS